MSEKAFTVWFVFCAIIGVAVLLFLGTMLWEVVHWLTTSVRDTSTYITEV